MPDKTIPTILTDADWQKKKGVFAKMAGETGIGAAMKAVAVEWKKMDWQALDPVDGAWAKSGLKRTPKNYETLFAQAKAEYTKVAGVRTKVKTLADLAEKVEAKFKASKTIPSSSREHVGKIAKEADRFWIELKSIDKEWEAEEKKIVAKYRKDLQNTADMFGKSMTSVFDKADKFVDLVKRTPVPATFNNGMPKAARDITQLIANVEKMIKEGIDIGKTAPNDELRVLKAWSNDGRKVDTTANTAAVLEEAGKFEDGVKAVKDWWR